MNLGHNKELLNACQTLHDYAEYVHRMRKYAKTMTIGDAVDRAIEECIQDGVLKEFLEQNRTEAKAMSIFEYNQEEHIRMEREEAKEEERANTERERQRADKAEARAKEAEARVKEAEAQVKEAEAQAEEAIAERDAEIAHLKALLAAKE